MRRRCLSVFVLCALAIFVAGSSALLAAPERQTEINLGTVKGLEKPVELTADDAPRTPLVILFQQLAPTGIASGNISQNFETVYDIYDTQGADDFFVSGGGGWAIKELFVYGAGSAGSVSANSMHVRIYGNDVANGIPDDGNILCDYTVVTPFINTGPFVANPNRAYNIIFPSDCVVLNGTRAWVSVVANQNDAQGAWFWASGMTAHPQSIYIAKWRNPGGGFNPACTNWSNLGGCSGTQTQWSFRLSGDVLPCQVDVDCNDNNACTDDVCVIGSPNVCANTNDNTNTCTDNNGCTQVDACLNGTCVGSSPVICNDSQFCTTDTCNTANGQCVFTPGTCNDTSLCTTNVCDEANDRCIVFSPPGRTEVCNTTSIGMVNGTAPIVGTVYPSTIAVAGVPNPAILCEVKLNNLTHSWSGDLDALLAKVGGTNSVIWSDNLTSTPFVNNTFTLADAAPTNPNPIGGAWVNGTYKPFNRAGDGSDTYPAPAPAVANSSSLAVFGSGNQNGNWNLWVVDDFNGDTGAMAGGWCLRFMRDGCDVDADCNDLNACNGIETCVGNVCTAGTPSTCNDNNVCTLDSCNPATGQCENVVDTCNDGNPCTLDSCNAPTIGCEHIDECQTFCANDSIDIPLVIGNGDPYPSTLTISSLPYPTLVQVVELRGLTHTFPDDIDIMIAGPNPNVNAVVMSDAGGGTPGVTNVTLTLADTGFTPIPDASNPSTGVYQPANYTSTPADDFPAPAPAPSGNVTIGSLNVLPNNPNGTWSLYLVDDATQDGGTLTDWCLKVKFIGCIEDFDCDDASQCTTDACVSGACQNTYVGDVMCNDGNPCTDDSCNAENGCQLLPHDCNDNNACTVDTCEDFVGCHNDAPPAPAAVANTLSWSTKTQLDWPGEPNPPFNVYRGSVASAYNHTCYDPGVASTSSPDASDPAVGAYRYYLVSRDNGCSESGLGNGTAGPRPNLTPCP